MKTKASILIIGLLINIQSYSQSVKFSLLPGFGFYRLEELKQLQQTMVESHRYMGVKAIHSFPPTINISASIDYKIKKSGFGIYFKNYKTGCRNSVKDYSGNYWFTVKLDGYSYGITYSYDLIRNNSITVAGLISAGMMNSMLEFEESLLLGNDQLDYYFLPCKSVSFGLEPAVRTEIAITNNFGGKLQIGYEVNDPGKIKFTNRSMSGFLQWSDSQPVKLDWSGIRTALGFYYKIDQISQ